MLFANFIIFPVLSFEKFLNSLLCPNSPLSFTFFFHFLFDLSFAKINLSFWLSLPSHIIRIQEKTAWKLTVHIQGCVCVCVCMFVCVYIWSMCIHVWYICIVFGICGLCVCVCVICFPVCLAYGFVSLGDMYVYNVPFMNHSLLMVKVLV